MSTNKPPSTSTSTPKPLKTSSTSSSTTTSARRSSQSSLRPTRSSSKARSSTSNLKEPHDPNNPSSVRTVKRQPSWRSFATLKGASGAKAAPPPPAVSVVFAQPEQGAPLASAMDGLPDIPPVPPLPVTSTTDGGAAVSSTPAQDAAELVAAKAILEDMARKGEEQAAKAEGITNSTQEEKPMPTLVPTPTPTSTAPAPSPAPAIIIASSTEETIRPSTTTETIRPVNTNVTSSQATVPVTPAPEPAHAVTSTVVSPPPPPTSTTNGNTSAPSSASGWLSTFGLARNTPSPAAAAPSSAAPASASASSLAATTTETETNPEADMDASTITIRPSSPSPPSTSKLDLDPDVLSITSTGSKPKSFSTPSLTPTRTPHSRPGAGVGAVPMSSSSSQSSALSETYSQMQPEPEPKPEPEPVKTPGPKAFSTPSLTPSRAASPPLAQVSSQASLQAQAQAQAQAQPQAETQSSVQVIPAPSAEKDTNGSKASDTASATMSTSLGGYRSWFASSTKTTTSPSSSAPGSAPSSPPRNPSSVLSGASNPTSGSGSGSTLGSGYTHHYNTYTSSRHRGHNSRPSLPHIPSIASSLDDSVPTAPLLSPSPPQSPGSAADASASISTPSVGISSLGGPGTGPGPGRGVVPSDPTSNTTRLAALNPSSSRFSLSLPLLGRPKVPLEKAVAAAQAADVRSGPESAGKAKSEVKPGVGERREMLKVAVQDAVSGVVGEVEPESPEVKQVVVDKDSLSPSKITKTGTIEDAIATVGPDAAASAAAAGATWWDYVGWPYQIGPPGSAPGQGLLAEATHSAPNLLTSTGDKDKPPPSATASSFSTLSEQDVSPVHIDMPSPDPFASRDNDITPRTAPQPLRSSSSLKGHSLEESQATLRPPKADSAVKNKAMSLRSADTGAGAQSWLAPWTWYASPGGTTANTPGVGTGPALGPNSKLKEGASSPPGGETIVDGTGRTDAERVKDEALAKEAAQAKAEAAQAAANTDAAAATNSDNSIHAASRSKSMPPGAPRRGSTDRFNPVAHTAASSKSTKQGWVSFFAAHAMAGKLMGATAHAEEKEGAGEMEVMDVPDDIDGGAGGAAVQVAGKGTLGDGGEEKRGRDESVAVLAEKGAGKDDAKNTKKEGKKSGGGPPGEREPRKQGPPALPLTDSQSIRRNVHDNGRNASPAPSRASKTDGKATPPTSARKPPNLVLPTWGDTFSAPPRSIVPPSARSPPPGTTASGSGGVTVTARSKVKGALRYAAGVLGSLAGEDDVNASGSSSAKGKGRERERRGSVGSLGSTGIGGRSSRSRAREIDPERWGQELPKAWEVVEPHPHFGLQSQPTSPSAGNGKTKAQLPVATLAATVEKDVLRGAKRAVIIGVHGWFPGTVVRSMLGEPTGTSGKFVSMMERALDEFQEKHGVQLEKVTLCPLEGEGTIAVRVDKLHAALTKNAEWMADLRDADVIFVATHSQGSIVSAHLIDRLIKDGLIRPSITPESAETMASAAAAAATEAAAIATEAVTAGGSAPVVGHGPSKPQRICCLALCGIHLGPLRYLNTSSMTKQYLQYFESAAALELFEFQNTNSEVSKAYQRSLSNALDHGVKFVYVASLDDQVVPVYSGLFTSAHHPLVLRALYIDGDAYTSSDFLSNLLVLLTRVLNAGLSDSRLIVHLSEATAGSLSGVGHSTPYEDIGTYSLAVDYLFLCDSGSDAHPKLVIESFDATTEQNDYEIPWSLRDIVADVRITHLFASAFGALRDSFDDWKPKTAVLRDVKRKLAPIRRLEGFEREVSDGEEGSLVGSPSSPLRTSKL